MRLSKIEIELQNWGEHKGKYLGKIVFADGTADSFQFALSPEICAKYLQPIAQEVINSANELGKKLAESFTRELSAAGQTEENKLLL